MKWSWMVLDAHTACAVVPGGLLFRFTVWHDNPTVSLCYVPSKSEDMTQMFIETYVYP